MLILAFLSLTSCVDALQLSSSGSFLYPEMTGAPPKGAKIAITFRGEYLRAPDNIAKAHWYDKEHQRKMCSDYWMSKENLDENIITALRKAGAEVKVYFHTYSYCPTTDRDLVADLKPAKFNVDMHTTSDFKATWGQVYSMFEAIRVVKEDGWADYVVMLRFDVSFRAKITSMNVKWDQLNIGWRGHHFEDLGKVDDLFFAMPKKYVDYFAAALKVTCGQPPELGLPPIDSGGEQEFWKSVAYGGEGEFGTVNDDGDDEELWKSDGHSNNTLSGYIDEDEVVPDEVYAPLVKLIGRDEIHFMFEGYHRSGSSDEIMYINRECGSHVSSC